MTSPASRSPGHGLRVIRNPAMDGITDRAVQTGMTLHLGQELFRELAGQPAEIIQSRLSKLEVLLLPELPRVAYKEMKGRRLVTGDVRVNLALQG